MADPSRFAEIQAKMSALRASYEQKRDPAIAEQVISTERLMAFFDEKYPNVAVPEGEDALLYLKNYHVEYIARIKSLVSR